MRRDVVEPDAWRAVFAASGETTIFGMTSDAVNLLGTVMFATPVAAAVLIGALRRLRHVRRLFGKSPPGARSSRFFPA